MRLSKSDQLSLTQRLLGYSLVINIPLAQLLHLALDDVARLSLASFFFRRSCKGRTVSFEARYNTVHTANSSNASLTRSLTSKLSSDVILRNSSSTPSALHLSKISRGRRRKAAERSV